MALYEKIMLKLYSIFHLNLAYSSIPESKRKEVIDRCFWPILKLATEDKVPIAIESPAYTLEVIADLEPSWLAELTKAIDSKIIEFIGSGYSQLIAPLVPAEVNEWNLMIGNNLYEQLLHYTPALWYINEQAYSAGIVEHYVRIGANAIIMEWNNPRTLHPEWDEEYRFHPQLAVGTNGSEIPVIWNDSITFQKFQRAAQGDIDIEDLYSYLLAHVGKKVRNFCLYGNDAEIFDFRPGRFKTEPELNSVHEWSKIREIYHLLRDDNNFELVFPSEVLKSSNTHHTNIPLSLESSVQPIPVKKQPKYNITRWAVTGRNNLYINTKCYEIYQKVKCLSRQDNFSKDKLLDLQKELCYLWSSDFRTHITQDRWASFLKKINHVSEELTNNFSTSECTILNNRKTISVNNLHGTIYIGETDLGENIALPVSVEGFEIKQDKQFLHITTPSVDAVFNCKRGLAIHSLIFPKISDHPLFGTVPHGYFRDVALSADWYSGHTVLQRPGKSQITDLINVDFVLEKGSSEAGEWIGCSVTVTTDAGPVKKRYTIFKDIPQINVDIFFEWLTIPHGSFKTGMLTLIPDSFEKNDLFYATHNGGSDFECFKMAGSNILHDTPGSSIVTASHGLGATEGIVVVGDAQKGIAAFYDQTVCAAMPMVIYKEALPSFFCRLMFSCGEMDESRVEPAPGPLRFVCYVAVLKKKTS
jgi:hypothetical protein